MAGTIQVSVLDFVVPQSSSEPSQIEPSQISVKVSIGERECQPLGKGDFSFPVTTFRGDFVVTLLDAQGNEISRADFIQALSLINETCVVVVMEAVKTSKVAAKGVLDEMFPLEGGGHVHMKLQYLFSDKDRQDIHRYP